MKSSVKPKLYIIAGPNGAGKTTFATGFLPKYAGCFEFVNADLIAQGLSPFNPASADLAAGKLMLEQIRLLAKRKVDFAFETTLSGKTYIALLEQLKKQGYHINLFFLWLPDVRLAIERIADRVKRGGHNVPPDIVKRRFKRGIGNLFHVYRLLCDVWILFDNSTESPEVIAYEIESHLTIVDNSLFSSIKKKVESV
jgi:predicted ABC-type ATPase